jgi:hypothetical protein
MRIIKVISHLPYLCYSFIVFSIRMSYLLVVESLCELITNYRTQFQVSSFSLFKRENVE